jgi:hypothetical protein
MSRFAYNRILAIIGLLFVITSGLFLLVSYWLLTGSEYVENIMDNIGFQFDYINIKNSIYEQVGLIKEKLSLYICGNSKNIVVKEEKIPLETSIYDTSSDSDIEDVTESMNDIKNKNKNKNKISIDLSHDGDSDNNSSSTKESNNTSDEEYVDENSDEDEDDVHVEHEHTDDTNDAEE